MKVEYLIFALYSVFFLVVTPIYWFSSNEIAGTIMLGLTFGLGALITFYLLTVSRRLGMRPEDRQDGEIAELAGEYGFFSPHSVYPLYLGGALSILGLGLVFAWWLFIIGAALTAIAVVGWTMEYYRGEFAH